MTGSFIPRRWKRPDTIAPIAIVSGALILGGIIPAIIAAVVTWLVWRYK